MQAKWNGDEDVSIQALNWEGVSFPAGEWVDVPKSHPLKEGNLAFDFGGKSRKTTAASDDGAGKAAQAASDDGATAAVTE